jgi:hypothetical protein
VGAPFQQEFKIYASHGRMHAAQVCFLTYQLGGNAFERGSETPLGPEIIQFCVSSPLISPPHTTSPNPHAAKTLLRGKGSVVQSRQATISATPSHPSAGSVSPTT